MKNLLVLVPDYPDKDNKMFGSIFVKEQIAYLKNYFDNIYVIAPVLYTFGTTSQSKYCINYSYDNVTVYFPKCWFYPRAITLFPISNYHKLAFDNRYNVIRNTIKKYNLKFDLIHSHMTFPATYAACKLKEEYNIPVVATIHEDSGWLKEEMNMDHPKLNYAWKNADVLIRVNQSEIPLLKKYNNNSIFIPNGFSESYKPLNKDACRKLLGLKQTDKIIFSYGSFDERKGFQTLIKAMPYFKNDPIYSKNNLHCYISGSGSYKSQLEKYIDDYKVKDTVTLLNFMPDNEVCNWINASDLFVFPSLRESFGITQLDALACGKPVIASTNIGSKEIICNFCGLLYDVGDAWELTLAIAQGLDMKWKPQQFIRDYIESKYSWKYIAEQINKVYNELL